MYFIAIELGFRFNYGYKKRAREGEREYGKGQTVTIQRDYKSKSEIGSSDSGKEM